MGQLTEVWSELSSAAGAAGRIADILAIKPTIVAPANPLRLPEPPRGEIAFENVSFAYPTRPETSVVSGLSLSVRAGETVAIVGPSGAGKSTLGRLLAGMDAPSGGTVTLGGVALSEF